MREFGKTTDRSFLIFVKNISDKLRHDSLWKCANPLYVVNNSREHLWSEPAKPAQYFSILPNFSFLLEYHCFSFRCCGHSWRWSGLPIIWKLIITGFFKLNRVFSLLVTPAKQESIAKGLAKQYSKHPFNIFCYQLSEIF